MLGMALAMLVEWTQGFNVRTRLGIVVGSQSFAIEFVGAHHGLHADFSEINGGLIEGAVNDSVQLFYDSVGLLTKQLHGMKKDSVSWTVIDHFWCLVGRFRGDCGRHGGAGCFG